MCAKLELANASQTKSISSMNSAMPNRTKYFSCLLLTRSGNAEITYMDIGNRYKVMRPAATEVRNTAGISATASKAISR